jgi:alpha-beta hydrolase superfamily lysophospholipase
MATTPGIVWRIGLALVFAPGIAAAAPLASCVTDSTADKFGEIAALIGSAPCGRYDELVSTLGPPGASTTLAWMRHDPESKPVGLAVLFMGGQGDARIEKGPKKSVVDPAAANFLVRSAQLFASAGYLTITLDGPEDALGNALYQDATTNLVYDQYRTSSRHAVDVALVIQKASSPKKNLPIFMVGTSRGALSAVALHPLGAGIALSSPVVGGATLYVDYVDDVTYPQLQPENVTVPALVLSNPNDGCGVSLPAPVAAMTAKLAGSPTQLVTSVSDTFQPPAEPPCEARSHHGFLGDETAAVGATTAFLDVVRAGATPGNRRPIVKAKKLTVKDGAPLVIDLATLAKDPDKDALSFSLPYTVSALGASLMLSGSQVTYTPNPVTPLRDAFVWVARDGEGGVSPAVVTVVSP